MPDVRDAQIGRSDSMMHNLQKQERTKNKILHADKNANEEYRRHDTLHLSNRLRLVLIGDQLNPERCMGFGRGLVGGGGWGGR